MAQLQFLSGSLDASVLDLQEEVGLQLGSAEGSHILVKDQAVEPQHATVYSVKGQFYCRPSSPNAKCFINFKPLPPEGMAVSDRDILMFGRTLAKFWRATAPSAGGGGGGAPDPRVARERDELRAQVAQLQQLLQAGGGASAAAKAQLDAANREKEELKGQLEQSKKQSRSELDQAKQEADRKLQEAEKARDAEKRAKEDLEKDLESAKKRADEAEARATTLKPDLEKKEKELEALRRSLEAFQTAEARGRRDRRAALREGSDLDKALAALTLPSALGDRLLAAVRDEIDREVLARSDGPVVPLRALRCPGCDLDLESELGSLKRRREKIEALKALGVAGLSADDAKALIAKVKAKA